MKICIPNIPAKFSHSPQNLKYEFIPANALIAISKINLLFIIQFHVRFTNLLFRNFHLLAAKLFLLGSHLKKTIVRSLLMVCIVSHRY